MENKNDRQTNIREEAIQILKTVLLLEKAFAPDYVKQILLGETRFPLRNINHKDLETYGALEGMFFNRILGIIDYLIQVQMLEVKSPEYGNLLITDKGEAYLTNPEDIIIDYQEIQQAWYENELSISLRKLRMDIAKESDLAPYQIFTNYTLRQIVKHLPETMVELSQFPGIEKTEETTRILIIGEISRIMEKKEIDAKTGIYTRANYPSHRKVRELFTAGMDPREIAKRRKVKLTTIEGYLSTLHRAGKVDMKPYIEETVDSKLLHKASKYFTQTENAKLKDAHEVLGIDYDTLEKARTYSSTVWEPALAYAS